MSSFLDSRYSALEEYVPGEQPSDGKYIKLNTNESPYPPSPKVVAALNSVEVNKLNLYPDTAVSEMTRRLAELYGVKRENVIVTNGSDEALSFAFMAYARGGVAFPDISYGFYKVYAELYGCDAKIVPLREDFTLDPEDYMNLGRMVVIANPNAPTGLAVTPSDVERIAASNPNNVVLIDEAYVDFGGESCVPLTKKYKNLLVVQTFSKYRSLAGARLGFAVGDAALIADLNKLKFSTNPYNINRLSMIAGAAALDDAEYYRANGDRIIAERERTKLELREMGFECTDSLTNFLLVKPAGIKAEELYIKLKENGVLVRYFAQPRVSDYLRITVGSAEQMDALLAQIRKIVGK